jgi:zinc protease
MNALRWIFSLAVVLAFSVVAAAQEKGSTPLPKDLPGYGPLVPFQAPNTQVKKLKNGLTLWLVPRPGFPKVALALTVRGGRAADPKDRPGLSDLLLATIDQGTKTRSAKQIAEEIQAAGGDLAGAPRADSLVLSTGVLASKVDAALQILADVAENAAFPDDEVALAKRDAADSLRGREADPSFLAQRTLARVMFGNHPYAVISLTQESISQTSPAELRAAYAQRFRPDQALLVAVGDFEPAGFEAAIEKNFGSWTAADDPPVAAVPAPPENNPHAIFLVPRPGSVQTTILLGGFAPVRRDSDYAAAQVANAIYAGMFGSRLLRNIREDKGYSYSPGASLQLRAQAGVIRSRADVRNDVTGPSLNEISYELNRMATTDPAPGEVSRAQRFLVGTNAIVLQVQGAVAGELATLWVDGLPPDALGQENTDIGKASIQDVAAAGRKYFAAARQTIVTVGEEKVVREQLAPFGLEVQLAPDAASRAAPE